MRWLKFSSINVNYPRYFSHHRGEIRVKMEKITDKIAALPPNENYFSLEFFPPKTQMVGHPRTLLTFLMMRPVTDDILNIVGLLQSNGSFRAHVTSTTSLVRYRHLGSRWKHRGQVAGARRNLSAPIAVNNMPSSDMHEYEPSLDR
jgi:hypothetical protein